MKSRSRKGNKQQPKCNLVAKHAGTFNREQVYADRKKSLKRGYQKHNPGLSNQSDYKAA